MRILQVQKIQSECDAKLAEGSERVRLVEMREKKSCEVDDQNECSIYANDYGWFHDKHDYESI